MRFLFHLSLVVIVVIVIPVPPIATGLLQSAVVKAPLGRWPIRLASTSPLEEPPTTKTNNDVDADLEILVISSIKRVVSSGGIGQPKRCLESLAEFGSASGDLITQKWLTPETLEDCACFWDDGCRTLSRDASRFLRGTYPRDAVAFLRFLLLAAGTFPFTPLLLPLIRAALEGTGVEESAYVPPSLSRSRRRAARRLRGRDEPPLPLDDGTPRDIAGAARFFRDGTFLLARDLSRGTLFSRDGDDWRCYSRFSLLALSTFPITPLLLPLVDRRRSVEGGERKDYVPSPYRPARLAAPERTRLRGNGPGGGGFRDGGGPVETLRAVADGGDRPPPAAVLRAVVMAQRGGGGDGSSFLDALAGVPGRRWELAYVAGRSAVRGARRRWGGGGGDDEEPWYGPLERQIFPWTRLRDGLYVDPSLVSAVQNFDAATMRNVNGVYRVLARDFFQTTVEGPFSWSERGGVCAFRPDKATFRLGSLGFDQDLTEDVSFEDTHIRDLSFFKFVLVDDKVAVAMGRSGSVAIWTRMEE